MIDKGSRTGLLSGSWVNLMKMSAQFIFIFLLFCARGFSQLNEDFQYIKLENLDDFQQAGKNWVLIGDVAADYAGNKKNSYRKGSGILMNQYSARHQSHLHSRASWGDVELDLEFMMFKGSNSGIYLQGRYEVQLLDSWTRLHPTWSDAGAIYARRQANGESFEGSPPVMNVARAPGLWQHLNIRFRAPMFNEKGEKIKNARFESVSLNGVVIQREVEVTGCTTASMFTDERADGPLVLQGDHGPVAFRNIRYRKMPPPAPLPEKDDIWTRSSYFWNKVDPVVVTPGLQPEIIRTFLMHGEKKLTHVLSVGSPDEINYSYDVKQGSVFQVWRGKFLDVTAAWWDRGWMQLGVPMGAPILFPNAPVAAVLADENTPWPDSVAFDDMHNKGYRLKKGVPVFAYAYHNMDIQDSIAFMENKEGIVRAITISSTGSSPMCRIATGKRIEALGNGLFTVDDKSYYIKIDEKYQPFVRNSAGKDEMLIRYTGAPVIYCMIW